jgi:acyl-coenzyme A synthetase/AMP-(fatty) acid ligase
MSDTIEARPRWIEGRPIPLDGGGPVDEPYDAEMAQAFETLGGFEVIERTAQRHPHKVAVDDGAIRLTYAQFIDRVYGLAERLIASCSPGAVVASLVHNGAAAPIITMACAMSGVILAPIDAGHPLERQAAIFAQSGAGAVLLSARETVDDGFIPASLPRLVVDPLAPTGAARPSHQYDPDAPLFISFTSGSTGRPKGVVGGGRYGGLALRSFVDMFHLNPSDAVLGLASLSTGGSRDAFAALGAGALMRVFDMRSGFGEALRVLGEEEITVLSFVPSALRMVLGIPGAEQAFRHLRVLDLHGERILASDIALFRAKLPATCHISVTMGSVEAGPLFSWFVRDDAIGGPVVPVGYPMPGRAVALLDEDGSSVADGDVGELFVRGAMSMWWRDGRMVSGPLLRDPDAPGSWIYPMGDLMRRRPDGLFEYVGRKDRRAKIRGLWADLGEVEAALRTLENVDDVVVITAGEEEAGERLVAFIAPSAGRDAPSPGDVRRRVAEQTAEHMAPSEILFVHAIPRLANFKPDLVRLKGLAGSAQNVSGSSPSGPVG